MKISIAVPMNNFVKFEVKYNTSKIDITKEYTEMVKVLQGEIGSIEAAYTRKTDRALVVTPRDIFELIVERLKPLLPASTVYRMYLNNSCYIEE